MNLDIQENFPDHEQCPVRLILDRLSDKWSVLVLLLLDNYEKLRFSEISHGISDISQKMLTSTLRSLEADGLLSRKYYAEIPPRVEYALTDLGRGLLPNIKALTGWAEVHMDEILTNRMENAGKKYNVRT